MSIDEIRHDVSELLDDIKSFFKPGSKITVLVRQPDDPQGRMDFMMGDDEPQEAMNLIARRIANGASPDHANT